MLIIPGVPQRVSPADAKPSHTKKDSEESFIIKLFGDFY
jgi:hypothetical protein